MAPSSGCGLHTPTSSFSASCLVWACFLCIPIALKEDPAWVLFHWERWGLTVSILMMGRDEGLEGGFSLRTFEPCDRILSALWDSEGSVLTTQLSKGFPLLSFQPENLSFPNARWPSLRW